MYANEPHRLNRNYTCFSCELLLPFLKLIIACFKIFIFYEYSIKFISKLSISIEKPTLIWSNVSGNLSIPTVSRVLLPLISPTLP